MGQTSDLIDVLKKGLREKGLTYARVAEGLGISESSVKRMFSLQSMSLERLAQVCALMSLEITDLLELARAAEVRVVELTEEQERTSASPSCCWPPSLRSTIGPHQRCSKPMSSRNRN